MFNAGGLGESQFTWLWIIKTQLKLDNPLTCITESKNGCGFRCGKRHHKESVSHHCFAVFLLVDLFLWGI